MWLYTVSFDVFFIFSKISVRFQILAAIGETLDVTGSVEVDSSLVTGVIVSVRPQFYRLSVWTRFSPSHNVDDETLKRRIESLGKNFKVNVLGFAENQRLSGPLATEVEFISHKDSEKRGKAKKLIA